MQDESQKFSNKETIQEKKVVSVTYSLYVKDDDEPWEEATEERPLRFIHSIGMMLPKFEENLKGLSVGDLFDFTIACDDAYGEREEDRVIDLDKSVFLIDGKFDSNHIKEGSMIPMLDTDGNRLNGIVLEVTKDKVKMDFNNLLAGEDLTFKGKVLEVRDATEEEIESILHPHKCGGCGGNGGCSGGCGGNGGCNGDGGCGGCGDDDEDDDFADNNVSEEKPKHKGCCHNKKK